jgi:hypothetical protein
MKSFRPFLLAFGVAVLLSCVHSSVAAGKYVLAFWREVAAYENQAPPAGEFGNHSVFVHVWDESGQALSGRRVVNSQGTLMGVTDTYGYIEIPLSMGSGYDFRVSDGAHLSDTTPAFSTERAPNWGHYSFEIGFLFKTNAAGPGTFDTNYVGILNASGDQPCVNLSAPHTRSLAYYSTAANDYCSDQYQLGSWADFHGQTFVATGNRIVALKAFLAVGFGITHYWTVQIHEGGPDGPAIGPPRSTRAHLDQEYYQILIHWGLHDVQVVPGRSYFMKITRPDGLNAWRLNRNNYPNGNYYENDIPVPGAELMGLVVCAQYTNTGPTGFLMGTVTDTNSQSLAGAVVSVPGTGLYGTAAQDGRYSISLVPVGTCAVTACKAGYVSATNTGVVINTGAITACHFQLTPFPTNNGGVLTNGRSLLQPFEIEPAWTFMFDAPWGSDAAFQIVPGGQSGSALQATRSSPGSSTRVQVFSITPNTPYEIGVWARCPSFASSYWTACAIKPGQASGQDFDENSGSWTTAVNFSDTGSNGNGDQWTRYTVLWNSGSSTQLSVGFKLGALNGSGPVVHWDQLSLTSLVLPALTSVVATSPSNLVVVFGEPVSASAAAHLGHYQLTGAEGPLPVLGAALADSSRLNLQTAPLIPRTDYTLTVSNVTTDLQPPTLTGLNGQLAVRVPLVLIPLEEDPPAAWKYNASGAVPSFLWRTLSFDDSAWPEGSAPIGHADDPLPVPLRTMLSPDTNRITVYFRKRFEVPPGGAGVPLRIRTLLDDGAVCWLNARHVFHLGMPETVASATTLATREIGTAAWEGPFDLPEPGLVAGTNVLAVEVHQANRLDQDVVFGVAVEALVFPSQLPTPAIRLGISSQTDAVVLTWPEEGMTLEWATDVLGPWTALPNAQSPWTVPTTNATAFFRLDQ